MALDGCQRMLSLGCRNRRSRQRSQRRYPGGRQREAGEVEDAGLQLHWPTEPGDARPAKEDQVHEEAGADT